MSTIRQYGRFRPAEDCFELTAEPPRKWVNVHVNRIGETELYSEVSNLGDGPIWTRDAQGRTCRLVSYDDKYLYVRDDDAGTVFSPWGAPAPQPTTRRACRYYAAKTEITGRCKGLEATHRVFCPRDHVLEAWTVTVRNLTDRPRRISVFAYARFQLNGCDAEGKGIGKETYSEVLPEIGGVFVTNRSVDVPSDRYKGYLVALRDFHAADGYRDQFLRSEFAVGTPKILFGHHCRNRGWYGPDCAGAVQVKLEIPPRGEVRADYLIGQAASPAEVAATRAALSPERLDLLCLEQEGIELARARAFQVKTGHEAYDNLFNIFVKKQMYSYLINKSGFRDNLQVDYAMALVDYAVAEDNFLRALASQYADGRVPHGFRPLNRLTYSDKPAWILLVVPELVKESGDAGLLEKVVPYLDSAETGTVWDHVKRTCRHLAKDTGRHGLCDQHHADWNDGLEATKEAGARESVMVSMQFCHGLLGVAELARRIGDAEFAGQCDAWYREFRDRINEVAWDGEWYVRTLCGDGYRIGARNNREGQIFLNAQVWAVLSGVADPERARSCMAAVDRLLKTDLGFRICYPGFSAYDPRVGRMSSSLPGFAENGGIYNHASGFKTVADCMLGRAEEAWETFTMVAPDSPRNPLAVSGAEPFSFNNMYALSEHLRGWSGYPWRTGTAAWFTVAMVEWILGARRHHDGLLVDPCLPKAVPRAKVSRRFRGATYHLEIDNREGRGRGVRRLSIDGKRVAGNLLPVLPAGAEARVKVVL